MWTTRLPFKALHGVRLKAGDLGVVGAFTSQGKSAVLRYLAYHLLTYYTLNVVFATIEAGFEATCARFEALHLNNKTVFPSTPRVTYREYRDASLEEEPANFAFSVAFPDWTANPNYGTLAIVYPGETRYTLADLVRQLAVIEQTDMPVHVLVIDYVPLMHPVPKEQRFPPQIQDYNQLFRDLKRYCMTYRRREGQLAPLLCLTAAQVSRKGYEEALKRGNSYDLTALSTYTEIERSADIVMTSMMTPAMKAASEIKLQVHKNRDGAVPLEPQTLYIDLNGGMGLEETHERTAADFLRTIQSIRAWKPPTP